MKVLLLNFINIAYVDVLITSLQNNRIKKIMT